MSDQTIAILLFLIFPTSLFVVGLRWLLEERRIGHQLKQFGKTLEAYIVNAGRKPFGRYYQLYYVTYQFSTEDALGQLRDFRRTQSISDNHLQALQTRSTVTVSYLPNAPMISRLSGADTDDTRQHSALACLVIALGAWCALLLLFAQPGHTPSSTNANATQAEASAKGAILHEVLDPRLPAWRAQAGSDHVEYHVSPAEAGLPTTFNATDVIYGYCSTASRFYVFVLTDSPLTDRGFLHGYAYAPGGDPGQCTPPGWIVIPDHIWPYPWYLVLIDTRGAASTAAPAPTIMSAQ